MFLIFNSPSYNELILVLNFFVNKKGFLPCPFFFFLIFSSFPRSISLVFLPRDSEHGGCFCFLGHAPSFPCLIHLLFLFLWWALSTTVLPSSGLNTGHVLVAITDFKYISCTVWCCCSYNRGFPPVWVKPDWASKANCSISRPRPRHPKNSWKRFANHNTEMWETWQRENDMASPECQGSPTTEFKDTETDKTPDEDF